MAEQPHSPQPNPHRKSFLSRILLADKTQLAQTADKSRAIMEHFLEALRKAATTGEKKAFKNVMPQVEKGILFRSVKKDQTGKISPPWAKKPSKEVPLLVKQTLSNLLNELKFYQTLMNNPKIPDEITTLKTPKKKVTIFRRKEKIVKEFSEVFEARGVVETVTYELHPEGFISVWITRQRTK